MCWVGLDDNLLGWLGLGSVLGWVPSVGLSTKLLSCFGMDPMLLCCFWVELQVIM